jgi:hypothetical protein
VLKREADKGKVWYSRPRNNRTASHQLPRHINDQDSLIPQKQRATPQSRLFSMAVLKNEQIFSQLKLTIYDVIAYAHAQELFSII